MADSETENEWANSVNGFLTYCRRRWCDATGTLQQQRLGEILRRFENFRFDLPGASYLDQIRGADLPERFRVFLGCLNILTVALVVGLAMDDVSPDELVEGGQQLLDGPEKLEEELGDVTKQLRLHESLTEEAQPEETKPEEAQPEEAQSIAEASESGRPREDLERDDLEREGLKPSLLCGEKRSVVCADCKALANKAVRLLTETQYGSCEPTEEHIVIPADCQVYGGIGPLHPEAAAALRHSRDRSASDLRSSGETKSLEREDADRQAIGSSSAGYWRERVLDLLAPSLAPLPDLFEFGTSFEDSMSGLDGVNDGGSSSSARRACPARFEREDEQEIIVQAAADEIVGERVDEGAHRMDEIVEEGAQRLDEIVDKGEQDAHDKSEDQTFPIEDPREPGCWSRILDSCSSWSAGVAGTRIRKGKGAQAEPQEQRMEIGSSGPESSETYRHTPGSLSLSRSPFPTLGSHRQTSATGSATSTSENHNRTGAARGGNLDDYSAAMPPADPVPAPLAATPSQSARILAMHDLGSPCPAPCSSETLSQIYDLVFNDQLAAQPSSPFPEFQYRKFRDPPWSSSIPLYAGHRGRPPSSSHFSSSGTSGSDGDGDGDNAVNGGEDEMASRTSGSSPSVGSNGRGASSVSSSSSPRAPPWVTTEHVNGSLGQGAQRCTTRSRSRVRARAALERRPRCGLMMIRALRDDPACVPEEGKESRVRQPGHEDETFSPRRGDVIVRHVVVPGRGVVEAYFPGVEEHLQDGDALVRLKIDNVSYPTMLIVRAKGYMLLQARWMYLGRHQHGVRKPKTVRILG